MSQIAKTIFSLLAFRVGGLPLLAALFLAVGVLWWFAALWRRRAKTLSCVVWLPSFLCTMLGGCLLFLFCEDLLIGVCALLAVALLYSVPALHRPKGGDDK